MHIDVHANSKHTISIGVTFIVDEDEDDVEDVTEGFLLDFFVELVDAILIFDSFVKHDPSC